MCMVIGVVSLVDHIHVFSLCTQNGTEILTLCIGLIWWNSKTKPKPKTKTKNWIKIQFDMLFIKFKWAVCSQSLQSASYIILHFLYHSLYHIIYKLNCQKSWDPPICTCCTCTCVAYLFFSPFRIIKANINQKFAQALQNHCETKIDIFVCLSKMLKGMQWAWYQKLIVLKTYINVHVCNFTTKNFF